MNDCFFNAHLRVYMRLSSGKEIVKAIEVPAEMARPLEPLSLYHDAPFEPIAAREATLRLRDRHELIAELSKKIAIALADELHDNDPYKGYDRKELRRQLGATRLP